MGTLELLTVRGERRGSQVGRTYRRVNTLARAGKRCHILNVPPGPAANIITVNLQQNQKQMNFGDVSFLFIIHIILYISYILRLGE